MSELTPAESAVNNVLWHVPVRVSFGRGDNVKRVIRVGSYSRLDLFCAEIEGHVGKEAWISLHEWDSGERSGAGWSRACGVGVDIDCHDGIGGGKASPSAEQRAEVFEAASRGEISGNAIYATPHGYRLIFVFARPCEDRAIFLATRDAAFAAAAADFARWADLEVDSATRDLARFFYTPCATVKGESRQATIRFHSQAPWPMSAPAPALVRQRPQLPPREFSSGAGLPSLPDGGPERRCPLCDHRDCYDRDDATGKGRCFSASHDPAVHGGTAIDDGVSVRRVVFGPVDLLPPDERRAYLGARAPAVRGTSGPLTPALDGSEPHDDPDDPGAWAMEPARDGTWVIPRGDVLGTLEATRRVMPRLRYNAMHSVCEAHEPDGTVRVLQDHDAFDLNVRFAAGGVKRPAGPGKVRTLELPQDKAWAHLVKLAREDPYDPLAEYQAGCAADPSALAELPLRMGLAEDDTQGHSLVILTMLAMAARAMSRGELRIPGDAPRPVGQGCKVDSVLVLVGPQEFHKSTAIAALSPTLEWVTNLHDIENKDAHFSLERTWIAECAELAAFGKRDLETLKSFLTTATTNARRVHGKQDDFVRRRAVVFGTTNVRDFLRDPTGNRRFWPVAITRRADLAWIRAHRDGIHGAARDRVLAGDQWWLSDAAVLAERHAEYAEPESTWVEKIEAWLPSQGPYVALQDALALVGVETKDQPGAKSRDMSAVLTRLGYRVKSVRIHGKGLNRWVRPESTSA